MRCPRCNATITLTNYVRNNEDGEWMVEIYCSECHYNEIKDVDIENQSLMDFAEMSLQRIHDDVKHDIIRCFETGRSYREGLLLEDKDGNPVEVSVFVERWKQDGDKKH